MQASIETERLLLAPFSRSDVEQVHAHWGNGYATEMARAMLEWGCTVLGMTTIQASLDAPNVASARVAERIGMTRMERPVTSNDDLLYFSIEPGLARSPS
jgi:predicted acetyltransferase